MSPLMIIVLALGAMMLYSAIKGGSPLDIIHSVLPAKKSA